MDNVLGVVKNGTASVTLNGIPAAPALVAGSAIVTQVYTAARLEVQWSYSSLLHIISPFACS